MSGFDQAVYKSIKKILWKHRYITLIIFIILVACKIQIELTWRNAENKIDQQLKDVLHIKDGYDTSVIISIKDTRRKVAAFSALIMKRYSFRRHDKKLKGMDKFTMDMFIQKNIRYTELLNLGYYDIIAIGMIESGFNPFAEGELQEERSMFQFSRSAVDSASGYYRRLPNEIQGILTFSYDDHLKDLQDPINSLKIAAILLWGLKKDYKGQMDWVITIYHWGKSYMHKFYKLNEFPEFFTFKSRKTKKIYERSCKDYFNTWYNITQNFKRGNIEVQKDLDYWKDIRSKMTIHELRLVDSYKTIKKLRYWLDEADKIQDDYEIAMRNQNKKIYKEVAKVDKQYKSIFGGLKTGQFGKFKTAIKYMKQSKGFFQKFRNEVYRPDQWQFWAIFSALIFSSITFIMVFIIILIKRKNP